MMKPEEWRGQMRAPADVIEWFKAQAKERFTSLNSVMVEALREYKTQRTREQQDEKK